MSESYRLSAARTLRRTELSAAKQTLSDRVADARNAEITVATTRERLERHRAETAVVDERERSLDEGGRKAEDLLRSRTYLDRRRAQERRLQTALDRARARLLVAERAVDSTRAQLARARAANEAVDRHHDRWRDAERRKDEAEHEAEVDDMVSARQRRE